MSLLLGTVKTITKLISILFLAKAKLEFYFVYSLHGQGPNKMVKLGPRAVHYSARSFLLRYVDMCRHPLSPRYQCMPSLVTISRSLVSTEFSRPNGGMFTR